MKGLSSSMSCCDHSRCDTQEIQVCMSSQTRVLPSCILSMFVVFCVLWEVLWCPGVRPARVADSCESPDMGAGLRCTSGKAEVLLALNQQPHPYLQDYRRLVSDVMACVYSSLFLFQAGVKGTLGRLVGIFENQERKHRTYVYVLIVTEVLEDWEDSVNIGRKREWFKIEDAIKVLQCHKPVQASYFETLRQGYPANNGTPVVPTTYSSSVSGIR
uniref:Nudix hydrolase domain-containing protein n=1 Tax=Mus spicilegus TaxID=10103 RepID=A0A8C6MR40_MUSSI